MVIKYMNKITIVTKELESTLSLIYYLRKIRRTGKAKHVLGGPSAVLNSLIRGLNLLDQPYIVNPPIERLTNKIIVLSSTIGLSQVIRNKPKDAIVLAGPNLVVLPSEISELLVLDAIDRVIVNSRWTFDCYAEDLPEIMSKLTIWPAGVDIDYWQTINSKRNGEILFYIKDKPDTLVKESIEYVKSLNYQVNTIKYGQYQLDEFKSALSRAKLAVYFSQSESQGISLLEAWAMDVPTLVWNPGYLMLCKDKNLKIKVTTSSAPYLTPQTGAFFKNIDEFKTIFVQSSNEFKFAPRDWVVENMTDEICAKKIINEFCLLEKK